MPWVLALDPPVCAAGGTGAGAWTGVPVVGTGWLGTTTGMVVEFGAGAPGVGVVTVGLVTVGVVGVLAAGSVAAGVAAGVVAAGALIWALWDTPTAVARELEVVPAPPPQAASDVHTRVDRTRRVSVLGRRVMAMSSESVMWKLLQALGFRPVEELDITVGN